MDTQNNLLIYRNNRVKYYNIENVIKEKDVISFNEYDKVKIKLNSEKYKVKIECYSYRKDSEYIICEDNILELKNDQEYIISDCEDEIDLGYIPSKYHIYLYDENNIYDRLFEVKYNKEVNDDGMSSVIDLINDFISGLSVDFFKSNSINSIYSIDKSNEFYIYKILEKNRKIFLYNVNKLINSFNNKIITQYTKEKFEKRQNYITIKKNNLNSNQNYFYNLKKVTSSNTLDNIILKRYLLSIKKIMIDNKINLTNMIIDKEKELKSLLDEEIAVNEKQTHSRYYTIEKENEKRSINGRIVDNKKWIHLFKNWEYSYNDILISINLLLTSNELYNLNVENSSMFSNTFYNNPNYHFFYKIYRKLSNNSSNSHKFDNSDLFADKKSYSIFEIYGFIIIQNILKELQFMCIADNSQIMSFSSDKTFEYVKDNIKIEVEYDHYCKNNSNLKLNFGEIINMNGVHCKPDYILKFFDLSGDIKAVLIVEIKYRRLENMLKKDNPTTDIDKTIVDYIQLRAINKNNKKESLVKNVIVLYPNQKEKCFNWSEGRFLGIDVKKDFSESVAYNELKIAIKDIIEEYLLD